MTTDQITAKTPIIADQATIDELLATAEEEASQIVAKARYDAFRMVTDARAEAEAILLEAKPVHKLSGEPEAPEFDDTEETDVTIEAVEQSGAILERAHVEAEAIVAAASERARSEQAELIAEAERLEARVTHTRAVLATLEERLAAIAATPAPVAVAPQELTTQIQVTEQPETQGTKDQTPRSPGRKAAWGGPTTVEPAEERTDARQTAHNETPQSRPVMDYSPSVIPPKPQAPLEFETKDAEERGSFYSRRSAKLPRIGDSAGHDALGAMRAVRMPVEQ